MTTSINSASSRPTIASSPIAKPVPGNSASGHVATDLPNGSKTSGNEFQKKLDTHSQRLTEARFAAAKLIATLNATTQDTSPKAKAVNALVDRMCATKVTGQGVSTALVAGLADFRSTAQSLSPRQHEQVANELVLGAEALARALSAPLINNPINVTASFDDILDGLQDLIGIIKDDYLDIYARMVETYAKLFAGLNEDVIGQLHQWLTPVGDKGAVDIDAKAIRAALDNLLNQYSLPNVDAVLFPIPDESGNYTGATLEDAAKWLTAMGLPASCLKQLPDGSYVVVVDLAPIRAMKSDLPTGDKPQLLPARFQAWQAAFNAQQQELESALQKHTQKYSNANSIHDNVQKVISSTLSALFEMLKAFSAALG